LATLRILEAIRFLNLKKTKFYQAGTSELFGELNKKKIFNENSEFNPKSPYGASKLFAHHITKIYRDSYKIFACNGILFNHESPRRGSNFVTNKVVKTAVQIKLGQKSLLEMGNLDSFQIHVPENNAVNFRPSKLKIQGARLILYDRKGKRIRRKMNAREKWRKYYFVKVPCE
jgi:GDP-D-mannose dehydratase